MWEKPKPSQHWSMAERWGHLPSRFLRLLPSEPMHFANLRIYFADFPECTFFYVPEHYMLGDLMRWWVRFAVGIWFVFLNANPWGLCVRFLSNNTPGFCFNAHNSQQWQYERWAAFFNLVPPLRITRKVERHKSLQGRRCGLWWKDSSPWEDWLVTWQVWRITTNEVLKRKKLIWLSRFFFLVVDPTCNLFLEYNPRFSVARFQKCPSRSRAPSLSQAIQRCAQHPDNSVYDCRWHEILPRSSIQRCMFV